MLGAVLDKWLIVFCILKFSVAENNIGTGASITTLYEVFLHAVKDDHDSPQVSRRVLVNNSLYQIHINKLKDVNGLKLHNIVITRSGPDINSTIYINNPLEAKLPHPFMSIEDFKNILVQQREKDREIFMEAQKKERHSRIWAKVKAEAQSKGKQKQKDSSKPGGTTHRRSILVEKITHTMRNNIQRIQEKKITTVMKPKLNNQEQIKITIKDTNIEQHLKNATINNEKIVTDKIKFGTPNKAKLSTQLVANDKSKYGVVMALKGETEAENNEVRMRANEKDNLESPVSEEVKDKTTMKTTSKGTATVKATTKDTTTVDTTTVETTTGTTTTDDTTTEATITNETTADATTPDVITTDETSTGDITTEATITDEITVDETAPDLITTDETSTGDITTEATTTYETTTEESTTTTSPTTKEKWSRPRVFMGEKPANATDT